MSFDGDLYPTSGATSVMTTKGDMVDFDAIRQRLAIGSANQILQVKSNLPSWETVPLADTVLTTAGDILYEDATPALARLASGTQYNTLQMGATLPNWASSATSILTTTGDLLYASGANTLARLAGGTSGDVLTANGAGVAPSYQTPAGGGGKMELIDSTTLGADTASIDTSFTAVDLTDMSYLAVDCMGSMGSHDSVGMRINNVSTGSVYQQVGTSTSQSATTIINITADDTILLYHENAEIWQSHCILYPPTTASNERGINGILQTALGSPNHPQYDAYEVTLDTTGVDTIDQITVTGGADLLAGSIMNIYKVTI